MHQTKPTLGDTTWFTHDRFGMFIHWGLYALPARHEWVKSREQLSEEHYAKYFKYFDTDLYDPEIWADAAANAGMKYFVVTTKHHDGFCLWDSALTDYKATNTPYGKDLLRPMVDAFRGRSIRTGFYHSLIDWHHPEYVIDNKNHPLRDSDNRDQLNQSRDQMKYADYLHGQVRELLTEFGDVDVLWFDFSFPDRTDPNDHTKGKSNASWRSEELYEMIRELAPNIVLNDRLNIPDGWDIKTPEQFQPRDWVQIDGQPVVWEACQTFSGSWGYHRDESTWRSTEQLITTLIDCVSKGGNLLLNVGPTGRGEFDTRALDRLNGIGQWMKYHSRSIYGCTQAPAEFKAPPDTRLTYNPKTRRLYAHLLNWPYKHIHFDGQAFVDQVDYAQLLNDASELRIKGLEPWQLEAGSSVAVTDNSEPTFSVMLPQTRPDVTVPVIEMFLK